MSIVSLGRNVWFDALRGVTVTLVILHHCRQATSGWLDQFGLHLPYIIYDVDDMIGLARMPAFFLCSGILFAKPMERGWKWFLSQRFAWAIWVGIIWTSISYFALLFGFSLYPWNYDTINILSFILIDPHGNLWFVSAIAILGFVTMALRNVSKPTVIFIIIGLSVVVLYAKNHLQLPDGTRLLLRNLGTKGLIFFTLGVALSSVLQRDFLTKIPVSVAAALVWFVSFYIEKQQYLNQDINSLWQFPATAAAIYILKTIVDRQPILKSVFARLGKQSLPLFLVHQFAIGTIYLFLPTSAVDNWPLVFGMMIAGTLILTLGITHILGMIPNNPLFVLPKFSLLWMRKAL